MYHPSAGRGAWEMRLEGIPLIADGIATGFGRTKLFS